MKLRLRPPLFSVILPTYRRPEMLRRAVRSVLRQTLGDFELLVVNDGGPDASLALLDEEDPRIRIIHNPANRGAAGARNAGVRAAAGKYLSFLDDDDEYLPTFLAETHARLRGTPSRVALSWCGVRCLDYATQAGMEPRVRTRTFAAKARTREALAADLLSIGTGFGLTIKAKCLHAVGGFDESFRTVEDADLFLRILAGGWIPIVVQGVHVVLHNHRGARLTGTANHGDRIRECERLLSSHAEFFHRHAVLREQLVSHIEHLRWELRSATRVLDRTPTGAGAR